MTMELWDKFAEKRYATIVRLRALDGSWTWKAGCNQGCVLNDDRATAMRDLMVETIEKESK